MVIRKIVWDAACDPKKARLFWEEFDHSRRILMWPQQIRWVRMMMSRSKLFSFWDEARAGGVAMGSLTYGISYGLVYPFYNGAIYGSLAYGQMAGEIYLLDQLIEQSFGSSPP